MNTRRIGIWLIGARGSISSAVTLGVHALRRGLIDSTGMITATEAFAHLDLVPAQAMEIGGCDIRAATLRDAAGEVLRSAGGIDPELSRDVHDYFADVEQHISLGCATNCGEAIRNLAASSESSLPAGEEIDKVTRSLARFKAAKSLDDVVVVNLASTEPSLELSAIHENLDDFEESLLRDGDTPVQASTIYAYAAVKSGYSYINFTPSNGALFPAIVELAERQGVPVMGSDGKTGETLVKSALAPMFACRNLEVMSWEGFNILGNMDGLVLNHPENRESKIGTKHGVLSRILGYEPHSQVGINYVPSLGDEKIAWDFIHFRGFLGARMSLQFVWQGCDSLLAAPLVLDLVRLADLAKRRGEAGLMPQLACFFKSPLGVGEHRLYEQFRMLVDYATLAAPGGRG
jgi:myo-inositol-1-phosphate synthase